MLYTLLFLFWRYTLKKKILAILIAALTVFATGCGLGENKIKLGTAGVGGIYNEFGTAFAEQINNSTEDYEIIIKATAGSAANLRLLSENYLELAIAQTDTINDAYFGKGTFAEKGKYTGYSAIAALYTEACQIIVKADSDIKTIDDLSGKKVSVGEKESGTEQNAKQILSVYGLNTDMIEEVNLDYTSAVDQLVTGKIDCMFCTTGIHSTFIDELTRQTDIRLLEITGKEADKLTKAYKFYTECSIDKNTYNGQKDIVNTLGVKSVLLASDKLSDDKVEEITNVLFSSKKNLQYSVSAELQLDEKSAVNAITIPFHSGAAKYYSSKGITVDTK